MNGTDQSTSNRLDAAQERLARAIGRLEAAVQSRKPKGDNGQSLSPELQGQFQALQAENAELRALVDSTAERLDGTIAKFKEKLAG